MLKKRSRPDTSHLENIVIALHQSRPEIFNRDGFSNDFQFYENMRKQIYRFDDNESSFMISQQDLEIVIKKAQVLSNEKQLGNQDVSQTRYLVNIPVGDNQVFDFGLENQNDLRSIPDHRSDQIVPPQSSTHQQMQVQEVEIIRQHKQEKPQVVTKQAEKQNLQGNQVKQSNNDGLAQREQNDPQIVQPDQQKIPAINQPNNNEIPQTKEVKPQIVQPDQGQHSPNNNQNLNNPTQRQMNNQITDDLPQQLTNEINPNNELPPTNEVALNVPNQNETEREQNIQLAQNNIQELNIQQPNQNIEQAQQYFMPVIQQLSWEQRTLINSINKELINYKCSRKEKQAQNAKNNQKMTSFFNVVKPKQINIQQRLKQLEQTMIPIGKILCKLKIDSDQRLRLVNFCLKGHKNNDVVIQKFQTYKKLNYLTGLQPKDRQFKYGHLYDRYVFF